MTFVKALKSNKNEIYRVFKETNIRLLGLDESIESGMVWLLIVEYNLVGFIRVAEDVKTSDYLKIRELYISSKYDFNEPDKSHLKKILDNIIISNGYTKAEYVSIDNYAYLNFMELKGYKFRFSKGVSYKNYRWEYSVSGINSIDNIKYIFGDNIT